MSDNTPVESLATDAPAKKQTMTDEERLELAAKLDRELDEFIAGLEKRRYTDGWPEDKWQEEMDKHPFFMKKAPEPGDELHPLYEGMQKLKYDPEENTAEELAQSYKEDGTFYMKHKKFRMAIYGYSEGLKQKCNNDLLNAQLYNNRSAANYFLRNYRSSLNDAIKALELKPDYIKAKLRAAQCCLELERYDECIRYCEELLVLDPINGTVTDIVVEASNRKLLKNRNSRRRQALEKKKDDKLKALLTELSKRSITFCEANSVDDLEEKDLIPLLPPLEDHMVSISEEDGSLEWPLAFCYPEYEIMDFQQKVSENATIFDCLVALFEDFKLGHPGQYKADTVNVYHDNKKFGGTHKLDVDKTIKDILNEKNFAVQQGTLVFYVLVKDSDEEREFLKLERKPFEKYAPVF
ncbi:DNA polymerase interacting tetratricopeptide repeat-containing, protein of 47 kDa [Culicoides brevitarsis]|uniref:DNA polymerase interacting tetratricopeptide repeat-containing, protein of 47 kDa n=1 Tax=Culicoides brevitarsis TaxID=469753 RepID=UPI00307B6857